MKTVCKKMSICILRVLASCAFIATIFSVNTMCWTFMYQEELPESAKRLKKDE